MSRFEKALAAIDAVHADDPSLETQAERTAPAELLYAERMTAMLARLAPDASEALQLAARAQHLGRFRVPRSSHPDGRAGYLAWRTAQQRAHARLAEELLAGAGYDETITARVAALVAKKNLATDDEARALEDCACLVFLEHYLEPFARNERDEDVIAILQKTWTRKMSEAGRAHALALPLGPRAKELVSRALA
ncbi:MAG: DUF4202 domain-containing protein [Sandaracinaceae bacterium]|nr:DUF4202 domain-containing protein [Sandaracinaceae bacterium]